MLSTAVAFKVYNVSYKYVSLDIFIFDSYVRSPQSW